tara:strand:+ start:1010 stop:1537 length:528 start_codon:yes stop_codon:yes gene_type:complete
MLYYDRAKIFNEKDVTKIIMPSKKTGFFYIFSSIMAVLTPFHIIRTYRGLDEYSKFSFWYSINVLLIIGFIIFNILIIFLFFWTCWGKETIEYNEEFLKIKKTLFGLGYRKEISIHNISSISINNNPEYGVFFVIKNGKVSVNTSEKVYNVGLGINKKNAIEIISLLNESVLNNK